MSLQNFEEKKRKERQERFEGVYRTFRVSGDDFNVCRGAVEKRIKFSRVGKDGERVSVLKNKREIILCVYRPFVFVTKKGKRIIRFKKCLCEHCEEYDVARKCCMRAIRKGWWVYGFNESMDW